MEGRGRGKFSSTCQRTAGTVKEAITSLDGIVDDIGGDGVVDLPEAEANLGHLIAAVELDVGNGSHDCDFVSVVLVLFLTRQDFCQNDDTDKIKQAQESTHFRGSIRYPVVVVS